MVKRTKKSRGGDDDDKNNAKEDPAGGPEAGNYDHGDILERVGQGEDPEEQNIS